MEMDFKNYLKQVQKKRLAIFDFDGTIANTPSKHPEWKGKDWWGHPESLTQPLYNGEVNVAVIQAFKEARSNPETKTVMLTGRRSIVAPHVKSILRKHDLWGKRITGQNVTGDPHLDAENQADSHEEYYSGDFVHEPDYPTVISKKNKISKDTSTFAHKTYIIDKLIKENGGFYEIIEMWEDRIDHLELFKAYSIQLKHQHKTNRYVIYQVQDGKVTLFSET